MGAGAAYSALGAPGTAVAQDDDSPTQSPARDHGWTTSTGFGTQAEDGEPICSSHVLSYLDVSWEPYGIPGKSDIGGPAGGWRHTFALNAVGLNTFSKQYAGWLGSEWGEQILPGLPYSSLSVNVPRRAVLDDPDAHPGVVDGPLSELPAGTETGTAVSARRHPATFGFYNRDKLEEYLYSSHVTPEDLVRPLDDDDLHEAIYEINESQVDEVEEPLPTSPISMATSAAIAASSFSAAKKLASNAGTTVLLSVLDYLSIDKRIPDVDRPPRYDHGFAATFPKYVYDRDEHEADEKDLQDFFDNGEANYVSGSDTWYGAGGHYLIFDVIENPHTSAPSVVDVASAFDQNVPGFVNYDDGEHPVGGWSLVFDTPAPDDADPQNVPTSDRFSAVAVSSPDVTRRGAGEQVLETGATGGE